MSGLKLQTKVENKSEGKFLLYTQLGLSAVLIVIGIWLLMIGLSLPNSEPQQDVVTEVSNPRESDDYAKLSYVSNFVDAEGNTRILLQLVYSMDVDMSFGFSDEDRNFEGFENFDFYYNAKLDSLYIYDANTNTVVYDDSNPDNNDN